MGHDGVQHPLGRPHHHGRQAGPGLLPGPLDAGLETLRRIVRNYDGDMKKLRYADMEYYILRKDGAYAGVSLWSHSPSGHPRVFAVDDGAYRVEKCTALLQGTDIIWPPF